MWRSPVRATLLVLGAVVACSSAYVVLVVAGAAPLPFVPQVVAQGPIETAEIVNLAEYPRLAVGIGDLVIVGQAQEVVSNEPVTTRIDTEQGPADLIVPHTQTRVEVMMPIRGTDPGATIVVDQMTPETEAPAEATTDDMDIDEGTALLAGSKYILFLTPDNDGHYRIEYAESAEGDSGLQAIATYVEAARNPVLWEDYIGRQPDTRVSLLKSIDALPISTSDKNELKSLVPTYGSDCHRLTRLVTALNRILASYRRTGTPNLSDLDAESVQDLAQEFFDEMGCQGRLTPGLVR